MNLARNFSGVAARFRIASTSRNSVRCKTIRGIQAHNDSKRIIHKHIVTQGPYNCRNYIQSQHRSLRYFSHVAAEARGNRTSNIESNNVDDRSTYQSTDQSTYCSTSTSNSPSDSVHPTTTQPGPPLNHTSSNPAEKICNPDPVEKFSARMAASGDQAAAKQEGKPQAKKKNAPKAKKIANKHELGISYDKDENFALWYPDVIKKAELIEYYDVSGCYILRPYAYFMWEQVQDFVNKRIKAMGVQNCCFPMFVSKKALETEEDHVEGFAAEVAWVTKSGSSDLAEPIAIRPTSETIMYPAYAKWIRSHRDLPLLLNQWTNVVRWEFKYPTPFIRTREFLWHEGHTAHATMKEAEDFTLKICQLYEDVYRDLYAVPVVKGVKSEKEKFAGGFMTTTVEAFIPTNGRSVQGATSHHLGENFSKMFGIQYEDEQGEKKNVAQTSWAVTTRSIGTMIMIHGDSLGLVLPPRVAQTQVVFVPIPYNNGPDTAGKCQELAETLKTVEFAGDFLRVKVDDRKHHNPGAKFAHHELKGVPIRLECGPKDIDAGQVVAVCRHDIKKKIPIKFDDLAAELPKLLKTMHEEMFQKAVKKRNESIVKVTKWDEVMPALSQKKLILAPWCETIESEEEIKKITKKESEEEMLKLKEQAAKAKEDALKLKDVDIGLGSGDHTAEEAGKEAESLSGAMKTLCIPLEQPEMPAGQKCFHTGKPAKRWCLFGRSY